jgi:hypothetical protein
VGFKAAEEAADAASMGDYRVRTTSVALIVTGGLALGATTAFSMARTPGTRVGIPVRVSHPSVDRSQANLRSAHPKAPKREVSHRHHASPDSEHLLVRVPSAMTVRARPLSGARAIGTLVASSKYYHVPLTAWIEKSSRHGRWGRVEIPYGWPRRDGWIPLRGLRRSHTFAEVHVDLSKHWVSVTKFGKTIGGFRAATGTSSSPTPPGEYFVTDRIPFSAGGPLGSFAFGISGIQPRLPAGWSGGNQLAIHGTSDPSSIGTSASAGCVRVSERALSQLKPLLKLGTPVVIEP